ncbi:MAG TPA: DUF456 domain-containing protein [Clostridia bacterium]|jgi:hypothetical protein|nr:DUF456 domain-containing protein [Clostridia bacterium]
MNQFIFILSLILIAIGYLGIFLPVLPGFPLILIGIFVYALTTGFTSITVPWLLLFLFLTLLGLVGDYLVGLFTVKKMGASKHGIYGALLGSIVGLALGGLPGLIIGQLAGMVLGEIYYGKEIRGSLRLGVGVFLGYILGTVYKLTIATIMVVIFLIRIFN